MTSDALMFVTALFSNCWKFFVAFNIPGTNFTPALAFLSLSVITLFVKFIKSMIGFNTGTSAQASTIAHYRDK